MQWSLIVCVAFLGCVAASAVTYEGHKVFQVTPTSDLQVKLLQAFQTLPNNYDFWTKRVHLNAPVDVMVTPLAQSSFETFLKRNKFTYTTLIEDVSTTIRRENLARSSTPRVASGNVTFTDFMTNEEINAYLAQLVKNYPNLVSTEVIGQTLEKRDITVLKISTGGTDKPTILIDAGIHAREWIAPATALYIINQLIENPNNKNLIEKVNWNIIPSLNPDGYAYTQSEDRMWRKNRSPTTNSNCVGVDPNRNSDFHWMEIGASSNPCSETYAGPSGFSEKETQALRDFVLKTNKDTQLYITFHSYGQYLLYPWGYTSDLPSDWKTLQALAEDVNDAISAVRGTTYDIGSSTNVLYAAAGGSDDWTKGVGGVALAYTIELPGGGWEGFDPPASDILGIVEETWEGVKVYQQYIEKNFA